MQTKIYVLVAYVGLQERDEAGTVGEGPHMKGFVSQGQWEAWNGLGAWEVHLCRYLALPRPFRPLRWVTGWGGQSVPHLATGW